MAAQGVYVERTCVRGGRRGHSCDSCTFHILDVKPQACLAIFVNQMMLIVLTLSCSAAWE